jgi:hypothetical protein
MTNTNRPALRHLDHSHLVNPPTTPGDILRADVELLLGYVECGMTESFWRALDSLPPPRAMYLCAFVLGELEAREEGDLYNEVMQQSERRALRLSPLPYPPPWTCPGRLFRYHHVPTTPLA